MKTSIATLFLSTLLWSGATVSAAEVNGTQKPQWNEWPVVGQATLSWLWLDIYSSRLRTPDGKYQQQDDVPLHPLALEIRYLRDIEREDLVEATRDQWQKMGYSSNEIERWLPLLETMLPNVLSGEKLIYVSDGHRGQMIHMSLQDKSQVTGEVTDTQFNSAFLAIWLSPNTQYPKLRSQLIGMNR